ncbi:MAG: DUF2520 domain-containing protein [Bacteroidia bacterium]|nr:DUF2520 domain-containing protein [Bacteroidia bacterium]NNJ55399.1 DUF2520 domain-containing protein [Bacteroidia bacterium]
MKYKITFIGSGNVATNLAHAFDSAGHTINQVVSRNEEHAKALASKFGAYYGISLSEIHNDSDFILICVNDEVYKEVIGQFPHGIKSIICHTSGPVRMDVLGDYATEYGVIYPLQSLTKDNVKSMLEVPVFIEWSSNNSKEKIRDLADSISNRVRDVNSDDRMKYHIAAVFANNFSNLMYVLAKDYLDSHELDFKNLLPIIEETALRLRQNNPRNVQTGPAKREDIAIVDKHLSMLSNIELKEIYKKLSHYIMTEL